MAMGGGYICYICSKGLESDVRKSVARSKECLRTKSIASDTLPDALISESQSMDRIILKMLLVAFPLGCSPGMSRDAIYISQIEGTCLWVLQRL